MPAREIYFTFDDKVKVNKTTTLQFVEEYEWYIKEYFQDIKREFDVDSINTTFLKMFIKELKGFDSVSMDEGEVYGKQLIIKNFIYDVIGEEEKIGDGLLKVRYLYDEWEYEGCGYNDHYYLTYTDDKKLIKKTIKETEKQVKKLRNLGVDAKLLIIE